MTPRLQERYEKEILPALGKQLGRTNRLALPRLEKVVVNMGVGSAVNVSKFRGQAVARALESLLSSKTIKDKCQDLAARLAKRDGLSRTADAIEALARDYEQRSSR